MEESLESITKTESESPESSKILQRMRSFAITGTVLWTAFNTGALIEEHYTSLHHIQEIAINIAENSFEKDLSVRRWIAEKQGVYVEISEKSKPNPFLSDIPDRDVETLSGKKLTLFNPAYTLRQINELVPSKFSQGHITSLKPKNPLNKPFDWEIEALESFNKGASKYSSFVKINNTSFLHYMKPLIVEDDCLKCHKNQGYKKGDVIGGISVTVPMNELNKQVIHQDTENIKSRGITWLLGAIFGILGYSSIKKNVHEKQEKNELVNLLLNSSAEGKYGLDINGDCTFINPAAMKMLGYGLEEVIGKNMHEIIHHTHKNGTSYPEEDCPIFNAHKKGEPIHVNDELLVRKDGKNIDVEYWATPLYSKGKQVGSVASFLDITKRKKLEQELILNRARLLEAQQIANMGHWELNLKTNKLNCSPKIYDIFGMDSGKFKESYDDFILNIHPDDREKVKKAYITHLEKEIPYDIEHRILVDGKVKWVHETCRTERDEEGRVLRSLGVVQDITTRKEEETERKKLEDRLLQSQKMEAIGTLSSGIAHDFNNILTPILGYSEILQMRLKPGTEEYTDINEIIKAGKRAVDLVKQILTFSRQKQGDYAVYDIVPTIKESIKFLKHSLPSTINILESYDAHFTRILCDPTQIQQTILNIGTNALHAMEKEGGTLEVKIQNYHISQVEDNLHEGEYLLLTLRDTGIGMDEKTKSKIFEPFFTTKEVGKGTGLGLSTAYGIIKAHKGDIKVYSELGKGTKFHIYLPISDKDVKSDSIDEKVMSRGDETIMLVDDEQTNVNLFSIILSKQGYNIEGYTNSESAFEAFNKEPSKYDLILTDQTMPVLTGLKLVGKIRSMKKETPIIIISGLSETITKQEINSLNIYTALSKPISIYDLTTTVRNALDKV